MRIAEAVAITILGILVVGAMMFSVVLASGATEEAITMHGVKLYKFFLGSEVVHLSREEVVATVMCAIGFPFCLFAFIRSFTL